MRYIQHNPRAVNNMMKVVNGSFHPVPIRLSTHPVIFLISHPTEFDVQNKDSDMLLLSSPPNDITYSFRCTQILYTLGDQH